MFKDTSLKNHPKELWILSLAELFERFAFWGVGNLLVLSLIEYYHFSNAKATTIYGLFAGCSTFLPLVGGYIADRWNYQAPLLFGALINALACFMLASSISWLLYPSLFFLALGYGSFTPSIVSLLGASYKNKPYLKEAGFSIYYASINLGVFLAVFTMGIIAKASSWHAAFFTAGIGQLIGLIPIFWYFRNHGGEARHFFRAHHRQEKKPLSEKDKDKLIAVAIFLLVSIFFWIAYIQGFSSMEIFVHSFMNKVVAGHEIPEGVFLSSESFFLVLLAPALASLYAYLAKYKRNPSPAVKTGLSFLFMAACFVVMMIGSRAIPAEAQTGSISSSYLIGAYFLMAVGEMLLAPIGLSLVNQLAPHRWTALLTGCWYVSIGIAFYIGGFLAGYMEDVGGLFHFFAIFVVLSLIPGLAMLLFCRKITRLTHAHIIENIVEPL